MAKKIDNFEDLFCHQLSDLRNAEYQLTQALPKMAKAASDPALKKGFETHLQETEEQLRMVDELFETLGWEPEDVTCQAMKGLIKEGEEAIKEFEPGPLLDVALIIAAQKVEHYEWSGYGSVSTLAEKLGLTEAVNVLRQIEEQESATDRKLTEVAKNINEEAADYAEAAE
jgi:ferritin-like metal-binding protein YciE